MAKTTAWANAFLKLVFQNIAAANIGDASGLQPSGAAGNFYISLHTADPGAAGNQSTSEATYTSYARVAVVRSAAGWTVASNVASNAAIVTFPSCTAGSNTLTHFGIGTDSAGAGNLLWSGALNNAIAISVTNPTPQAAIGAITVTET